MPLTHSFIDREIQRIKNLEDVSEQEKTSRIKAWQKMKAHAVPDDLPENPRAKKNSKK